ncbi:hypothetical protein GCM10027414_32190 [Humibacter ginsengiterrae]
MHHDVDAGDGIRHAFACLEVARDVLHVVARPRPAPADDTHGTAALPEAVDDQRAERSGASRDEYESARAAVA